MQNKKAKNIIKNNKGSVYSRLANKSQKIINTSYMYIYADVYAHIQYENK